MTIVIGLLLDPLLFSWLEHRSRVRWGLFPDAPRG